MNKSSDFLGGLEPRQTAISFITRAEISCGMDDSGIREAAMPLDQYVLPEIDRDAANAAARLRRAHGWKLPDASQAALARLHQIKPSNRNTKDFNPKKTDS